MVQKDKMSISETYISRDPAKLSASARVVFRSNEMAENAVFEML